MAQFAEADVGEERGDLPDPAARTEVEQTRGGDRIDDPVDERPLEAERDTVLRLLGELEAGFLLCPGTRT